MIVTLHTDRLRTLQHVREFLEGNQEVDLVVATRAAAYGFIEQTLGRFDYVHQGKAEKGLLRCFLAKVTAGCRAPNSPGCGPSIGSPGASPTAAGRPDGRSPAATRASTSGFSPSSTGSTAPCPGRRRKRYRDADIMTPYEKLKSLPEAAVYLTPGTTFQQLDAVAFALSDNDAARALHEARARLFRSIDPAA